ncbi:MAG: FUSC family protein [Mesorhizobium sp.]|nr:FUSC family protein [Mesorhizobium sp.]MBL8579880.1 FUSC family protein [Mesorhizobium sp.]
MSDAPPADRESIISQIRADLAPFPGRAALTWRIALLCSLVSATAMLFETPEAAISCYLIIFLMKSDAVINVGTALGLIVLATVIVAVMVVIIQYTVDSPLLRMATIAFASFLFLYIGAASQLGEIGGIIALIIAFVLTLINLVPVGDAVSFGLRYAWYMAAMPMAWMVVFNFVLGLSPVRLLRQTLLIRLNTTADAIASGAPAKYRPLLELLRADNGALEQQAGFVKILAFVSRPAARQISADVRASYRLMLAASALPDTIAEERRTALVSSIRVAASALEAGEAPAKSEPAGSDSDGAEREILMALDIIAGCPEGPVIPAPKPGFFFDDALTNPAYQRFALKTTAAAMICYLVYAGINWQGIHTAMITCYVAALSSTGETVHKLALRITGCLIGAALGVGAILFVIPHIDGIGALMVLVFAGVLVGAWVSTGPERISYGGVQIALAFLLTVLQGFGPSTSLDTAWDRILGILLGNLVVYLIFTRLWPVPVEWTVRNHLAKALTGLSRLAALEPQKRTGAVADAALVEREAGMAAEALDLIPFEPASMRAKPNVEAALRQSREDIAALTRTIYLSRTDMSDVARQLKHVSTTIAGTASSPVAETHGGDDDVRNRLDRIQRAAIV